MIIGVPKEIKTDEYRVALTPAGARELTVPVTEYSSNERRRRLLDR